ncbi:MAG: Type 1 glutamine amidotransferase-like domain-containing protein [Phycisphaeraceae bacterium]|nr:Type 1 glutamine amidotransferase-like domain-containing protein [Phycisphaeraceae bacterium]
MLTSEVRGRERRDGARSKLSRMVRGLLSALVTTALTLIALTPSDAQAQGYICAEGGGGPSGGSWAPSVFGWMVQHGGAAKVVVLGTSGTDPAIQNAFLNAGASSVTFVNVTAANANNATTAGIIASADIIWMRGGDQWQYINLWNNTLTEAAIRSVYDNGGVVGGTSAGCAVLGKVIYNAQIGSLTPKQALQNSTHPWMTFTTDFLELVPGVLFDTHFTERGRIGRLAPMLANRWQVAGIDLLGIGVDDRTALCVYPDLTAEVRGEGSVTFLHRVPGTFQVVESGKPAIIAPMVHTQLTEGYRYDLVARQVIERPESAVICDPPSGHPSVSQAVQLNGSNASAPTLGEKRLFDSNDPNALFLGKLTVLAGNNRLARTFISSQTWNSTDFDENRVGGPQWGMTFDHHWLNLLLDGNTLVNASEPALLTAAAPATGLEGSIVILDSYGMTSSDVSTYLSSANSIGPRQSSAIENARLHLIRAPWSYRMDLHRVVSPAGVADINFDGSVDGADLALLLGSWGAAPIFIGVVNADLNNDGVVDGSDLALLLGSWSTPS